MTHFNASPDLRYSLPPLPLLLLLQLRPKDVFNPKLQRAYQVIQHRALQRPGDSNALPVSSSRILQPFLPSPAIFSQAKNTIAAFQAACPLAPAGSSTSGRKRGVWGGGGGDGKRAKQEETAPPPPVAGVGLQLNTTSVEQVALPPSPPPFDPHRHLHAAGHSCSPLVPQLLARPTVRPRLCASNL